MIMLTVRNGPKEFENDMRKSVKKLMGNRLCANIFLTLVCISPIIGMLVGDSVNVSLPKAIGITAVMIAIIAVSWTYFFVAKCYDKTDEA